MNEFEIFMSKYGAGITREYLVSFMQQNRGKVTGPLEIAINGLDKAITVTVAALNGHRTVPTTRADRNARLTAMNGRQALDTAFPKVEAFVAVLESLERVFNANLTGAFEIPVERRPGEDMRYDFATTKFVGDHIAPYGSTSASQLVASARSVAKRRMVADGPPAIAGGAPVPAFTNITVSSTMALSSVKISEGLKDEITSRQQEFEAIYRYLTSHDNRLAVLMQGEHEEVVFTTTGKYKFYEATRPATPTTDPTVTSYAENHLRYSVQQVGDSWKLHHMAGRVAPTQAGVAPNITYQAFSYTHVPGIAAVAGTFSKIG